MMTTGSRNRSKSKEEGSSSKRACVNLRAQFGKWYRVTYEDSYHQERAEFRSEEEPWLQIIPCRLGHIFPWGGHWLGASLDGHRKIATRMKKKKFLEVVQQGDDDGTTFRFHMDDFARVAKIMRPHRRPRLSNAEREARRQRMLKLHKSIK